MGAPVATFMTAMQRRHSKERAAHCGVRIERASVLRALIAGHAAELEVYAALVSAGVRRALLPRTAGDKLVRGIP